MEHVKYRQFKLDFILLGSTGNAQRENSYRTADLRPNISVSKFYFNFTKLLDN
jgi:hypothetical protein